MILLATLLALAASEGPGRDCTEGETAAFLAPGSPDDEAVRLTCRVRLGPGQVVTRRILIEGEAASGAALLCEGAVIGRPGQTTTTRAPTVAIWSARTDEGGWSRPRDVTIRGCRVYGAIRVWGAGAGRAMGALRASSQRAGHTERMQAAAPLNVRIEDVTLSATGSIPLYVGPGVTGLILAGSRIDGRSESVAVYLDAESADNTLTDNVIAVRTGREMIAVDGSARNRISGNRIDLGVGSLRNRGGVFLYRNCGEDGVVRHQTPSDNRITGNVFVASGLGPVRDVVVGAREGNRRYCDDDAGYPFGSSLDDGDGATGNAVSGNCVQGRGRETCRLRQD